MMKNPKVRIVFILICAVVVIGGVWFLRYRATISDIAKKDAKATEELQKLGAATSNSSLQEEDPGATAAIKGQIIRVEDQIPGFGVVIAQANLKSPSWIVIHDNNNGKPGNVIGSRLFGSGSPSGIIVVSRALEAKRSYIAVLHTYDGSKKDFNYKTDLPTLDEAGNPIMTVFSVISTANLKN